MAEQTGNSINTSNNPQGEQISLILQTAFLGDLCLSIPLMKHVRRIWPNNKIHLVCRSGLGEPFILLGLVDVVHEVKKGDKETYKDVQQNLRKYKIEYAFVPHMSIRSALFLSGLKVTNKVGFQKWWNRPFFNHRVVRHDGIPDALRQLMLLIPFEFGLKEKFLLWQSGLHYYIKTQTGQLTAPPEWSTMGVRSLINKTCESFKLNQKFGDFADVLIFPGSVWETKKWVEKGFVDVAKILRQRGFRVFICGSTNEKELCERIAIASQTQSIAGQTSLIELLGLMTQAKLVIGNDSGSSHLAAMAEAKSVSIFGPTVLNQGYRPWSNQSWIVEVENLGCRPCGKHGHKKCPLGTHDCMKHISDEHVIEVVNAALATDLNAQK